MGKQRLKLYRGLSNFVPVSSNFSDLEQQLDEDEVEYDPSDNGLEQKRNQENLQYEEMIMQILFNLEDREKIIFIFQLLRDDGYQIDHGTCAKVINLSRRQYMRLLDTVRMKSALFIKGYNKIIDSHKETE